MAPSSPVRPCAPGKAANQIADAPRPSAPLAGWRRGQPVPLRSAVVVTWLPAAVRRKSMAGTGWPLLPLPPRHQGAYESTRGRGCFDDPECAESASGCGSGTKHRCPHHIWSVVASVIEALSACSRCLHSRSRHWSEPSCPTTPLPTMSPVRHCGPGRFPACVAVSPWLCSGPMASGVIIAPVVCIRGIPSTRSRVVCPSVRRGWLRCR